MTRVLFSPHAIRTSEERHVESPVKGLLNEKLPLSPEPYKPLSQLKYPGGQGGPTEYFFSEDLVPHCPVTSPFTQGSENLMTLQKVSADSASPRSCNRRLFGSPLEAKENDFNQSTSTPPSSLKTFHAVGKHEDIFSTSASPSPLK